MNCFITLCFLYLHDDYLSFSPGSARDEPFGFFKGANNISHWQTVSNKSSEGPYLYLMSNTHGVMLRANGETALYVHYE